MQNRLDEEIATHDERLEKRVHELEELSDRLYQELLS
jgi:phosphate uptake regulator